MKRRIARKVLSLVTAVALVFGLAATAYASNDALTRAEMVGLLVEGAGLADQAAAYAARPSAFQDVA